MTAALQLAPNPVRLTNWVAIPRGLRLKPGPRAVLSALLEHAQNGRHCYPSQARLAEYCGVSTRSVIRHVAVLEEAGYVTVDRANGLVNSYRIEYEALNQAGGPARTPPKLTLVEPETEPPTRDKNDPGPMTESPEKPPEPVTNWRPNKRVTRDHREGSTPPNPPKGGNRPIAVDPRDADWDPEDLGRYQEAREDRIRRFIAPSGRNQRGR